MELAGYEWKNGSCLLEWKFENFACLFVWFLFYDIVAKIIKWSFQNFDEFKKIVRYYAFDFIRVYRMAEEGDFNERIRARNTKIKSFLDDDFRA